MQPVIKSIFDDIRKDLRITAVISRLPLAVVFAILATFINRSQLAEQMQTNSLNIWGDTIVFSIAFFAIIFVLLIAIVAGYTVGGLIALVLFAAIQTQTLWIAPPIFLLGLSVYLVSQGYLPLIGSINTLRNWTFLNSSCTRHLRQSPLARQFSLSKTPYLLYPISCTLLN